VDSDGTPLYYTRDHLRHRGRQADDPRGAHRQPARSLPLKGRLKGRGRRPLGMPPPNLALPPVADASPFTRTTWL
jgi:hypothetical protein